MQISLGPEHEKVHAEEDPGLKGPGSIQLLLAKQHDGRGL